MGRLRAKTRKAKPVITESTGERSEEPPTQRLFEKAQTLVAQCNYDLAKLFLQRILDREPDNLEAREMLGVVLIESGDLDAATEIFQSLVSNVLSVSTTAHLYLAQLTGENPRVSLQHYQAAVENLTAQLKGKERAPVSGDANSDERELKDNIVGALVSMVELWMDPASDLCTEPEAENTCEDLLNLALQTDPGNAEALQALASVRLSQQRPEEAKQCLEQAWSAWKDLEPDDPRVPAIPVRITLVKLLLELSLFAPALSVLQGIKALDSDDVEAWYLEGWCFYLMAEQAKESGLKLEDLTWEELAQDARDSLEACQTLHIQQDHPDTPMLDHTRELIASLDALGIKPSPEDGGEGDGGEWEDVEGSDDGDDGDVDMS